MVGDETVTLNPILASMFELAEELEQLGLVYHDGTASYVEVNHA